MNEKNVDSNSGSGFFPGSPIVPPTQPGQGIPGGETKEIEGKNDEVKVKEEKDDKKVEGEKDSKGSSKDYDELVSRLGTQGKELGEYRQFFQNIAPLLDKLDASPELVQAIIDGKVDKDVTQAIIDGKVNVEDAADVQKAHENVKEKLGEKAYDMATPAAVAKLVEAEVSKFRKEFEEKADLQSFQDYSQKFIEKTSDFQDYADEIDKWLDTHDVTDIEVAYYAVKGQMSEAKAKKAAETAAAEKAKEVMSNATGGGTSAQFASDGTPVVDKLIAGRPNPNTFLGRN